MKNKYYNKLFYIGDDRWEPTDLVLVWVDNLVLFWFYIEYDSTLVYIWMSKSRICPNELSHPLRVRINVLSPEIKVESSEEIS